MTWLDPGWLTIIQTGSLGWVLAKFLGNEQAQRFIRLGADHLLMGPEERAKTKRLKIEVEEEVKRAALTAEHSPPQLEQGRRPRDHGAPAEPDAEASELVLREDDRYLRQLVERADSRVNARELRRQVNLESVLVRTLAEPPPKREPGEHRESSPAVVERIIEGAAEAEEEEVQVLWSKLLANEVVNPGRFSLRTLDVVRNLSNQEAHLFHQVCKFALEGGLLLTDANAFEEASGINDNQLVGLSEAGLLNLNLIYTLPYYGDDDRPGNLIRVATRRYFDKVIVWKRTLTAAEAFDLPAHVFTRAARELGTLGPQHGDPALLHELAKRQDVNVLDYPLSEADLRRHLGWRK